MCALVVEAIGAGAAGFSTSFAYTHRGMDGKPVPSRFAEPDEVEALFLAAGQHRQGRGARHRGRAVHLCRHVRLPAAHRPPVHLSAVRAGRTTATIRSSHSTTRRWHAGLQVWPQVTPRPLTMQFTMDSPFSLNVSPVFGALMDLRPRRPPRRVRRRRVAGPRRRRPREQSR